VSRRLLSRKDRRALGWLAAGALVFGALGGQHVTAHALASPAQATTAAPAARSRNVALGQDLAAARGWTGPQWSCLYALWERESGWQVLATYPSTITPPSAQSSSITTAYGIPQALPAQKMATAGPDWRTDAATQIRWGLGDIAHVYGTPCAAWAHETTHGWY
jgi:resuscitation-promoting factor RpfB